MNPLNVAKSIGRNIIGTAKKRNSLRAVRALPATFAHLPSGGSRYKLALYFSDAMVNAYQIRQWYEPLRQLASHVPVVVIVRNANTALQLRKECPLPIFFGQTIGDIEAMLDTQDIGAVYYVNQNIRNFQMMRFNEPAHVFISHGESEKAYMWSNQLKAYDYVFSAGQAARERLNRNLTRFDAAERTKLIGRPQIDVKYPVPTYVNPAHKTVLYAPTWEGDRPTMSYGSVSSHGVSLVNDLIADGNYNIIFRPHPRSGINSASYKASLEVIRSAMESSSTPGSPSYILDETTSWGWQWGVADICITDISAVAYDWMATAKPMLVTTPVSTAATVDDSPALLKVPSLSAEKAMKSATIITEILQNPNTEFQHLVEYYFGDTTPGASMSRFIHESLELLSIPSVK